jgi:hypothetical protein
MSDFISQYLMPYAWLIAAVVLAVVFFYYVLWYARKGQEPGNAKFKLSYLLFWPWLIDRRRTQRKDGEALFGKRELIGLLLILVVAVIAFLLTSPKGH